MEEFINNEYTTIAPTMLAYTFTKADFPNNDDDFWMDKAMDYSPLSYRFLSDRLKRNTEYIRVAMEEDGALMEFVPDDLKDDYETVWMAVCESAMCFQYISERLRDNEQLLMQAIDSCPMNSDSSFLYYASERLLDDPNIIMEAIKKFSSAYGYASVRLRQDLNFAMDALTVDNYYHGSKEIGAYMTDKIRKQMGNLLEAD